MIMKKALLFSLFIGLLFACKKDEIDPDYPFTIVVKTYEDSIRIANIRVEILAPSNTGAFVEFFQGFTNDRGEVTFEYDKNAVFTARATRGLNPISHIGCADVRLEPNAMVYKTVFIQPFDPEAGGCDYIR